MRRSWAVVGAVIACSVRWAVWIRRSNPDIPKIVFSDIDGTLVHYPWQLDGIADVISDVGKDGSVRIRYRQTGEELDCWALVSKTSGSGYISKRTLELVARLRAEGIVFVLITGARSSTYLKRRDFLPVADFEVFESGGRIWEGGFPDPAWSSRMEVVTGFNGTHAKHDSIHDRPEQLWVEYRDLEGEGWQLDTVDYETEFRVVVPDDTRKSFDAQVLPRLAIRQLAHARNLGKVDVFPVISGKANAARYILQKLGFRGDHAAMLFDDDNDLELARMCKQGFLPGISDTSVQASLLHHPEWKVMPGHGPLGTEQALEEILSLVH